MSQCFEANTSFEDIANPLPQFFHEGHVMLLDRFNGVAEHLGNVIGVAPLTSMSTANVAWNLRDGYWARQHDDRAQLSVYTGSGGPRLSGNGIHENTVTWCWFLSLSLNVKSK